MNRSLVIPAACCLIAFAALLTGLHGGALSSTPGAAELRADREVMPSTRVGSASEVPNGSNNLPLTDDQARELVSTVVGEYLRPWRQFESAPRYLLSRAAPRPIPAISADFVLAASVKSEGLFVGTVTVNKGAHSQQVPCTIDRYTKHVWLYVDGQWLAEDEWVKSAPMP